MRLRQNHNREAPRLATQVGRYVHAKQYKRMRAAIKTLRTRVGRVQRDVQRQFTFHSKGIAIYLVAKT